MTTVNMKSELLMESRLRAESRQPLQRRRLAKTASACAVLENGECDPDLNLAIQESLKLARQNELKQAAAAALANSSAKEEDEENEPGRPNGPPAKDKSTKSNDKLIEVKSSAPKSGKAISSSSASSSSKQLEGLLMLHLDLIQHQQELITTKDKEIVNLRGDKEALKCRLERMERRMAILKHKEDVLGAAQQARTSTSESPAAVHTLERSQKRKSSLEPQSLSKKFAGDVGKQQRRVSSAAKGAKSQASGADRPYYYKRGSRRKVNLEEEEETPESLARKRFLQKREKIHDEHTIIRTDKLSQIVHYVPPFEDGDEAIHERLRADTAGKRQAEVEIPTWRYRTVPNCYTLEGTENLEDEVFTKRHQKPEYEEKRRKRYVASKESHSLEYDEVECPLCQRVAMTQKLVNNMISVWDLQRLREQRMYEHLKEKEKIPEFVGPYRPKDNHTITFFPSIEDITHIEVCDKIPVSAFGCPIPFIKPSEFDLPWEHQIKKPRAAEKNTPKSTRWNMRRK